MGNAFFARRLLEQALVHHQTCQELVAKNQELITPELNLQVLTALANDYLALGHSEQALRLFEESMKAETENDRLQFRAERFWQLAQIYQETGDLVRARGLNIVCSSTNGWQPGSDVQVTATYPYKVTLFGLPVWSGNLSTVMKERVE